MHVICLKHNAYTTLIMVLILYKLLWHCTSMSGSLSRDLRPGRYLFTTSRGSGITSPSQHSTASHGAGAPSLWCSLWLHAPWKCLPYSILWVYACSYILSKSSVLAIFVWRWMLPILAEFLKDANVIQNHLWQKVDYGLILLLIILYYVNNVMIYNH